LLRTLQSRLPGALLFGQAPLLVLPSASLRFLGGALVGQRRFELRRLVGKSLPLPLGVATQRVLGFGAQTGLVHFAPPLPFARALVGQAGALGPCGGVGLHNVHRGLVDRHRRLGTGKRVRRGIGFNGRQRHVECVVPMRFLRDHARVQAVRKARRVRFAAADRDPPRRGRARGRRGRWRRQDGIDESEAAMRRIRLRLRRRRRQWQRRHLRCRQGRNRRRRQYGRCLRWQWGDGRGRQADRDGSAGPRPQSRNAELQGQHEAVQQQGNQHTHRQPTLGCVQG